MRKRPLGCLTLSGIITGILVILVVVGAGVIYGGVIFSPGSLNAQPGALIGEVTSHAAFSGRCSNCHAFFWQKANMADRCMACHTDIAAQLNDPKTLHGDQLKKRPGTSCQTCHPDHRGGEASLVDMSMVDVSHDSFGFVLNAHQKQSDGTPFTCRTCHVNGYSSFDQAICTTCHKQINADFMHAHTQRFGENCLACHDGVDTYGHNFSHNDVPFKLTGKHVEVDCTGCHAGVRSILDLKSSRQDCYSCHAKDDAHLAELGSNCGRCHTSEGWSPATFDHAKSKFPLTGAHLTMDCTQCHLDKKFVALGTSCYACHAKDDPHKGQFGRYCNACHDTTTWMPPTFDHAKSKFPLTGTHASLKCSSCHINNIYTALDPACYSCHAHDDAHEGQFGTSCDACHTTAAWLPPTFDHAKSDFPLTGAHATAQCSQCHVDNIFTALDTACYSCHAKDDTHNGQFGTLCNKCHTTNAWLPASFDHSKTGFSLTGAHTNLDCSKCHPNNRFTHLDTACNACHAKDDAHNGQFGQNCAQCHSTSAWKPASFDHSKTGFQLTGAHAKVPCESCHTGRNFGGLSSDCYSCHARDDAHNGQFGKICGQCHSTSAWKPASFDHSKTGFQLTGAHASLACDTCHINGIFGGLSPDCYSCHAGDDAHNGQFGQVCGQCHSTTAWKPASFDHSKTGFSLTGAHTNLECGSCHTSGNYGGLSPDCYSCHAKDDAHNGQFGQGCGQCHSTSAWLPASFDHSKTGFPLTGAHTNLSCDSCHTNGNFGGLSPDCYSCHAKDDAHNGQFGQGCGQCHSTTAWLPASFDHSKTGFPLTGAHSGLACIQCHTNGNYGGLSPDCSSCHSDPAFHAGLFGGMPCNQCHNTSAWSPAQFPLPHPDACNGEQCVGHQGATCRDCHTVNLMTASCLKCHDSNDPGGGGDG